MQYLLFPIGMPCVDCRSIVFKIMSETLFSAGVLRYYYDDRCSLCSKLMTVSINITFHFWMFYVLSYLWYYFEMLAMEFAPHVFKQGLTDYFYF